MIKEHPILFKPEMVRAVLEGRKTQTRRIIRVQPDGDGLSFHVPTKRWFDTAGNIYKCPYGVLGDRLWVRETFCLESNFNIDFEYNPPHKDGRPINWEEDLEYGKWWEQPHYRATDPDPDLCYPDMEEPEPRVRWTPSIFMKRWASRINLEVTRVRVQRVQKISKKDALAEGVVQINRSFLMDPEVLKIPVKYSNVTQLNDETYWGNDHPRGAFASYFEKINGEDAWNTNKWLWVVDFKWDK